MTYLEKADLALEEAREAYRADPSNDNAMMVACALRTKLVEIKLRNLKF